MNKPMQIKTPVFKNASRSPARLVGTADGVLEATAIVGITSGLDQINEVLDGRDKNVDRPKSRSGNMLSVFTMAGGAQVLVMGTAVDNTKAHRVALGLEKPAQKEEDADGNGVDTASAAS